MIISCEPTELHTFVIQIEYLTHAHSTNYHLDFPIYMLQVRRTQQVALFVIETIFSSPNSLLITL